MWAERLARRTAAVATSTALSALLPIVLNRKVQSNHEARHCRNHHSGYVPVSCRTSSLLLQFANPASNWRLNYRPSRKLLAPNPRPPHSYFLSLSIKCISLDTLAHRISDSLAFYGHLISPPIHSMNHRPSFPQSAFLAPGFREPSSLSRRSTRLRAS